MSNSERWAEIKENQQVVRDLDRLGGKLNIAHNILVALSTVALFTVLYAKFNDGSAAWGLLFLLGGVVLPGVCAALVLTSLSVRRVAINIQEQADKLNETSAAEADKRVDEWYSEWAKDRTVLYEFWNEFHPGTKYTAAKKGEHHAEGSV